MDLLKYAPASGFISYVWLMCEQEGLDKSVVVIPEPANRSVWFEWGAEQKSHSLEIVDSIEKVSQEKTKVFVIDSIDEAAKLANKQRNHQIVYCEFDKNEGLSNMSMFHMAHHLKRYDRRTGKYEVAAL